MATRHDQMFGRHSTGPWGRRKIWEEIAMDINSLGPPIKDAECWRQCWNSFQTAIKNKLKYHREKGQPPRQAGALQYPNTLNHDDQAIIGITGIPVSQYDLLPTKKAKAPIVLNHSLPPVVRTYTRIKTRITHTESKAPEQITNLTVKIPCQTISNEAAESNQVQSNSPNIEVLVRRSSCNTEPADIPLASQEIQPADISLPSPTQTKREALSPTPLTSTTSNSILPCDLSEQNEIPPRRRRRYVSL